MYWSGTLGLINLGIRILFVYTGCYRDLYPVPELVLSSFCIHPKRTTLGRQIRSTSSEQVAGRDFDVFLRSRLAGSRPTDLHGLLGSSRKNSRLHFLASIEVYAKSWISGHVPVAEQLRSVSERSVTTGGGNLSSGRNTESLPSRSGNKWLTPWANMT